MKIEMLNEDIEKIGHALSTIIQIRYVCFYHISRGLFLDSLDKSVLPIPLHYSFSLEDVTQLHKKAIKVVDYNLKL